MVFWASVTTSVISAVPPARILGLDSRLLADAGLQLFNVAVLVVALRFLLYKPVKNFMDARVARIQSMIDNAADEERKSAQLSLEYEAQLQNIRQERDEILQRGHDTANRRSDEIIAEARREAESIYRKGVETLRMEQASQQDEMKRAIIDVSTQLAARFVEISMDEKTQHAYVERAMQDLEDMLWDE